MSTLAKLTGAETRLFLREPVAVLFTLAFPSVLIGILGSVRSFREPSKELGGVRVIDLYVTISVALVLAMLALQVTPTVLAGYREKGILRRLSTTPVHPATLLAAQLATSLMTALVAGALVLGIGRFAFAVPVPRQFVGFLVSFLLTAVALFAVGLLIAAVAPSGRAGSAIGTVLFFPVMFFAGLWVPREAMPALLRRIGDFTPLGAGEQALHDAATGSWPHTGQVAVLAAYVVVCGLAAARLFRWE
ncbi:MAG TPA: ABC transporter permease [Planosporangium sp.]|nr:ABC transporter permease [Planosporangium sp.]